MPRTPDGFRASWGKAVKNAAISGHKLRDVRSILDAHYLHRDPELARKAIHKLEMDYARRSQEARTGTDSPK
jgi:hypothetical protein